MQHLAAATTSTLSDKGTCEMDSHADTCAVDNNFVMLKQADHFISGHPFAEEYKSLCNIPIGTVAPAWMDSKNQLYLLVFMNHFSLATACNTL